MTMQGWGRAQAAGSSSIETARAALAYAALALGIVGTAAIAPLILWGLAARGFH